MRWGELLNGSWAASLSATVIILAVLPLRALFQDRTPRRVFCLLWDVALARLLVLTALPSPVSVWQWLPATSPALLSGVSPAIPGTAAPATEIVVEGTAAASDPAAVPPVMLLDRNVVLAAVWLAVGLALAVWFLWSHLRSCRLYVDSLPCGDVFIRDWLTAHRLRRSIQARTSDRIAAPLTYGVLRPVVLLPSGMDWMDETALSCILEHEYQHIRRFDTLRKALLAAALCLHWFNPLVWVLYVLSDRDMELACDEAVTAQGVDRAEYAHTLLSMEEQRGRWGLSGSHFSQNELEERIRSIMKRKRISIAALIAVMSVMSITVAAFASAAPGSETGPRSGQNEPKTGYVYNHFQAVEGDVMILSKGGEDGEKQYSVDGGKTWLSEEDYRARYGGSDWQVEWWTAEDYAAWLEEEKQLLQSIIGERGYTGGEGWFTWDQKRVDEAIALYESILEDIKNGALYSKSITDQNGGVVEDTMLGSGTLNEAAVFSYDEKDAAAPEAVDEATLLEELKKFGISEEKGNLVTSQGMLIRYLVDGVAVGDSGYSIRYVYNDPDGVVDVHTLRSVIRDPDGSYNPMGELIGVVAAGDTNFDQGLIDSASFTGGAQTASTDADGQDIGTLLKKYEPFGLRYEFYDVPGASGSLRMSWNGTPIHSLYDTETGTWFANNLNGTELPNGALDLETVYHGGKLCGLRETSPGSAAVDRSIQMATAEGDGSEGGRRFEEIFARYQPYGLTYSPRESGMGSLTWNGQDVKSFADLKLDGGVFSYEDPNVESGLRVYTEYDADGDLTGLRAQ